MRYSSARIFCAAILFVCVALPSHAIHHLMQVEQIIGAVNGDTSAQAIQLRMRSPGQNVMAGSQLWVYDATGLNGVQIVDFSGILANGLTGDRVLITTAAFNSLTSPQTAPDYTMSNRIPDSYFAAGRLTFEEDDGTVLWSIAWGGDAYTGSNEGELTNDDDGDFGPPFDQPLPSAGTVGLLLNLSATGTSSTNADDYALTDGTVIVNNNAGSSFVIDVALPEILVKRPRVSDAGRIGEKLRIRWETSGALSEKVAIELFKGGEKVSNIKKRTNNDGKFNWLVPEDITPGDDYQIRVRDKANDVSDLSAVFSIES